MSHNLSVRAATLLALGALVIGSGCQALGSEPASGGPARTTTSPAALPAAADASDVTGGPAYPAKVPGKSATKPTIVDGIDWTMPSWVRPAPFSGFFSEDASPSNNVGVHGVDVSWRQVAPRPGVIDFKAEGDAQDMHFDSLSAQLAEPGPYWFRMFASGVDWAPQWVIDECKVGSIGTDYDGQDHLPIWNACVWGHLRDTWRLILRGDGTNPGLYADPDFRFAYIPGAFTWAEFDYEMTSSAAKQGKVTEAEYLAWYRQMIADFAEIGGAERGRLVFTGEDYPWGPWPSLDLLATEATKAGLGIRNGITEVNNFHLSETPAYGSSILPNGHLGLADTVAPHLPGTVIGTENECFTACGFKAKNVEYVVTMANLKALQLGVNWLYVVPGPSFMGRYPQQWDWVRLSIGQTAQTSPDAWAVLRDAEDVYWRDTNGPFGKAGSSGRASRAWKGRPYVRNLERWLVQTDVRGAVAHRTQVDVHKDDPTKENGTAYEGLQTKVASGDKSLAFTLDPRFLNGPQRVLVKVTYWDAGSGSFRVRAGKKTSAAITFGGQKKWRTATVALMVRPGGTMRGGTDLWIDKLGAGDAAFQMVRVVRLTAPVGG